MTEPRVLMVSAEYPPMLGGVGDYTALLSTHLALLGAHVVVLTTRPRAEAPIPTQETPGPRVLRTVPRWGYTSWTKVAATATACEAGVIHLQYQAAAYAMHPAVNLLPGYLRARLRGIKVITTFHDLRVPYLFPKAGSLRHGAVRALDALSHGSVLTNQADFEDLAGSGTASPAKPPRRWLIPLGSNIDNAPPPDFDRVSWRQQVSADEDTLLVSYFGLMNDSKGVEFLVQALGVLVSRGLRLKLLIVGGESGETDPTNPAYSHRIGRLIKSRHLGDSVYWTGFLPPELVSASLLSSDLCVLPFRDGASLRRGSLLAALVHGLPIVTTLPERSEPLLVDGENVVMVGRDSPAGLANAVESLWSDPGARARLSANARSLSARFAWPDIASRHLEMYRELADRG